MNPEEHRRILRAAPDDECHRREREVLYLINLIEPDPRLQPCFFSDQTLLADFMTPGDDVRTAEALKLYLGVELEHKVIRSTFLWQLVDLIKAQRPDWPEPLDGFEDEQTSTDRW